MSEQLTEEQITEIRDTFNLFDKDKDGAISIKEMAMIMKSLGQNPTEMELQEIISDMDTNGNGVLEFEEFSRLMSKKVKESSSEEELSEAFKVFDKDGNGYISASELKSVMSNLGEKITNEDIDDMIKEGDTDGDGQISFKEFVRMMLSR